MFVYYFMQRFNVYGCQPYLVTLTSLHRIRVSVFLQFADKNNIMLVMQKLKIMLEFSFTAIIVECLHSSLVAKLWVVGWCDGAG